MRWPKKVLDLFELLLNEDTFCSLNCGKRIKSYRTFYTYPKYLIIIIKQAKDNRSQFSMNDYTDIDIKNYISKNEDNNKKNKVEYELVSIMDNNSVTYSKYISFFWYEYRGEDISKINFIHDLSVIPILLIYKNKNNS